LPAFVTDAEFDLLDELYFVTSFRLLAEKTGLPGPELENQLRGLLEQGLIRSFWPDPDTELAYETTSFGAIARDASYLASKEGLLQHNTR
jgi:DNA-binding Lrp family transcriptional regulator